MTADDVRGSWRLTGRWRVKGARESLSPDLGPEIYHQIESYERKIAVLHAETKTLTTEFEAEVKCIADWITKKIEVDTELSSQREQQLAIQGMQTQHAQETRLRQDHLDAVLAQSDWFSWRYLENAPA